MKSIAHMPMHEYDTFLDSVVKICREPRDDWGITVRELATRLKVTQNEVYGIAESDDALTLNVAVRAGSGIYNLPKGDSIVEVDEEIYKETLTYRK